MKAKPMLTARVPGDVLSAVEALARRKGTNRTKEVTEALRSHVKASERAGDPIHGSEPPSSEALPCA